MVSMYRADGQTHSTCHDDDFRGRHDAWIRVLDETVPWNLVGDSKLGTEC